MKRKGPSKYPSDSSKRIKREDTISLTQEQLRAIIQYDSETGNFFRIKNGKKATASHDSRGYSRVYVEGKYIYAHRLAFFYMTGAWPEDDIDHIDLNKSNNKWVNLRPATRSQNFINKAYSAKSRKLPKNISTHTSGLYRVRVGTKEQGIVCKYAKTLEEAENIAAALRLRLYGEYRFDCI